MAELIKIGEPPPTPGGDEERQVAEMLRDGLSDHFCIVWSFSLPTKRSSFFYEMDLLVAAGGICDLLEVKFSPREVRVYERQVVCADGHSFGDVFAILETKGKVLSERILSHPFQLKEEVRVETRLALGPSCPRLKFEHSLHETNKKVLKAADLIAFYQQCEKQEASRRGREEFARLSAATRKMWSDFRTVAFLDPKDWIHRQNLLGRFTIEQRLVTQPPFEYLAVDEPPCAVQVHLREYLYNPTLKTKDLEASLDRSANVMRLLRRLRHTNLTAIIGHFRTGYSLVQVSDWFDGRPLEQLWAELAELGVRDKIVHMVTLAEVLDYCHQEGAFHRDLAAANVLLNDDLTQLRLTGFEFGRDADETTDLTQTSLARREQRIVPPEQLAQPGVTRDALPGDIFQLGILFYRLIENGEWPFESTLAYQKSGGAMRPWTVSIDSGTGLSSLTNLVTRMLSLEPKVRPGLMSEVTNELRSFVKILGQEQTRTGPLYMY